MRKSLDKIPLYSAQEAGRHYLENAVLASPPIHIETALFTLAEISSIAPLLKLSKHPFKTKFHSYLFLTEGQVKISINAEEFELKAGNFSLVCSGEVVALTEIEEGTKGYMGTFSEQIFTPQTTEKLLSRLLNVGVFQIRVLPQDIADHIGHLFRRISVLYETPVPQYIEHISDYFVTILNELFLVDTATDNIKVTASQKLVGAFKMAMSKHIYSDYGPADYATVLSVSTNHLNKVIKRETGFTTIQLIAKRKIVESEVLLKHSSLSIADIAYSLGFDNPGYFSKFFKKHTSLSPGEFRQEK